MAYTYGETMHANGGGTWAVQHWRGDNIFANGLDIVLPVSQTIVDVAQVYPGSIYTLSQFSAGAEILLSLTGSPQLTLSTSYRARFLDFDPAAFEYYIDWEDWIDNDYNDSHTRIFRQELANPIDMTPVIFGVA